MPRTSLLQQIGRIFWPAAIIESWGGIIYGRYYRPGGLGFVAVFALVSMFGVVQLARATRSERFGTLLIAFFVVVSLILGNFAQIYWGYGTGGNFNEHITRFRAVYFAIGTLSTAGTGNIFAVSTAAQATQMAQEVVDLLLLAFGVGALVARFTIPLRAPTDRATGTRVRGPENKRRGRKR
jgi:hypothetical protein